MDKYQAQATLGILGMAIAALPMFVKLPSQFQAYNAVEELQTAVALAQARTKASEDVERNRIEQRKQTSDALHDAGVLPSGQKLKIRNYLYDSKVDPDPDTTGYLADDLVYVYDSSGSCIGRIYHRKWQFKPWFEEHQDICSNAPAM